MARRKELNLKSYIVVKSFSILAETPEAASKESNDIMEGLLDPSSFSEIDVIDISECKDQAAAALRVKESLLEKVQEEPPREDRDLVDVVIATLVALRSRYFGDEGLASNLIHAVKTAEVDRGEPVEEGSPVPSDSEPAAEGANLDGADGVNDGPEGDADSDQGEGGGTGGPDAEDPGAGGPGDGDTRPGTETPRPASNQ